MTKKEAFMKGRYFLLLIFLLPLITCKKNNNLTGDYMVCNINGKGWSAGCSTAFSDCLSSEWSDHKRAFNVSGDNDASKHVGIGLYDSTGLKSGTFLLNIVDQGLYQDFFVSSLHAFNTDSVYTGSITINFDSLNSRVSGTFSFRAILEGTLDTVVITGGRFSLSCQID